jgi:hypothetical protein
MQKKPIAPKIFVPFNERPKCSVDGCTGTAQIVANSKVTGLPQWRKVNGEYLCNNHHSSLIAEKRGLESMALVIAVNAGFNTVEEYQLDKANKAGYDSVADYHNSKHRYRCNRLDYCQNCAGEAVWVDPETGEHKPLHDEIELCTYTISKGRLGQAMLSVDHINGNNNDDRPENHQTLCHNCHKAKSLLSKDHWSCEKKLKHLEKMLKSSS